MKNHTNAKWVKFYYIFIKIYYSNDISKKNCIVLFLIIMKFNLADITREYV